MGYSPSVITHKRWILGYIHRICNHYEILCDVLEDEQWDPEKRPRAAVKDCIEGRDLQRDYFGIAEHFPRELRQFMFDSFIVFREIHKVHICHA